MTCRNAWIVGLFPLLSGCGWLSSAARVDPVTVAQYPSGSGASASCASTAALPINLDCFQFPEAPRSGDKGGEAEKSKSPGTVPDKVIISRASTPQDGKEAPKTVKPSPDKPAYDVALTDQVSRNRLTDILMTQSDEVCAKDSASMFTNEAAINGVLNIMVTGLGSAGAIVTGERVKTILAGSSSFLSGTRDHINASVYRNQITQAITAAIDAERSRLADQINQRRNEGVATFTVDGMIRMVNQYHQACSFYKGLELTLKSAQNYPRLEKEINRQNDTNKLDRLFAEYTRLKLLRDSEKGELRLKLEQDMTTVLSLITSTRSQLHGVEASSSDAGSAGQNAAKAGSGNAVTDTVGAGDGNAVSP